MRESTLNTSGLRSWADVDSRDGPAVRVILVRVDPLTIDVGGRPGVGKSAVIESLGGFVGECSLTEVHGVDSPDHRDPVFGASVLLYVLVGSARRADLAALESRNGDSTVVVLGKADALTDERAAVDAVAESTGCVVASFSGDPAMVRSAVEDRLRVVAARRDIALLDDLERLAAERVSLREPVEVFLRQAAAGAVRNLWARR